MYLVGDIGGTKTRLAVFSPEVGPREFIADISYPSQDFASLEAIVQVFLDEVGEKVEAASFGLAGPVTHGRATITNLPWQIEELHLRQTFNFESVTLLNDVQAVAASVPSLQPQDVHTIHQGRPVRGGSIAVVAPGTGLGEGYLTWDGAYYNAPPSQGGHTDFGPLDALQDRLLVYLRQRIKKHISYEHVCSGGLGIPNLYSFFKDTGIHPEPDWLREALAAAEDPTPVISAAASEGRAEIAAATMRMFVSILGAEAGNMALKVLSTGGVYLGGGIPPRIIPMLEDGEFMRAFLDKGRMEEVMRDMPVHVILNKDVALLGASYHAFRL